MTHPVTPILTLVLAATLSIAAGGAQALPNYWPLPPHPPTMSLSCLRSDRKRGERLHHFVNR